jgi:membrane dipeptidase
MNSLGMLVDISHVSDETFWDTLEVSRAPVIASHSSVRSRASHPRNLSDEMLRAIAAGGGLVMINFSTMYLDERKTTIWRVGRDWLMTFGGSDTSTEHVADHIDHVGIGSDFDGTPFVPSDLSDVSALPNLTTELLRRGYSETEIRKILGENVLRVLETADRKDRQRPRPDAR